MENKNQSMLMHSVKGTLYLLIIEFVFGMVTNLYAVAPDDAKYATESVFIKISSGLHMLLGTLFPIFSIVLLFTAFKSNNKQYKKYALFGFLLILLTTVAGFLTVGLKEEAAEMASFVMALGFMFSFVWFGKFYLLLKK